MVNEESHRPIQVFSSRIRRRVFWFCLFGLVLVGASVLVASNSNRWQIWRTPAVSTIQSGVLSTLDATYATGGAPAILATLAPSMPSGESNLTLDWIVERKVQIFYPQLIAAIGDTRVGTKLTAIALSDDLPSTILKPYLTLIESFYSTETNSEVRRQIKQIIDRILRG